MTRKKLTVLGVLGITYSLSTASAQRITRPTLSCTAAKVGTPNSSQPNCAGTNFTFPVIFQVSDGTTSTVTLTEYQPAYGVCATTYPGCESYNAETINQDSPPSVTSFTVSFSGKVARATWVIKQPSVKENGSCACPSPNDPTANPNGFEPLVPGNVPNIEDTQNAYCPY